MTVQNKRLTTDSMHTSLLWNCQHIHFVSPYSHNTILKLSGAKVWNCFMLEG